jgi:hypothetical protein
VCQKAPANLAKVRETGSTWEFHILRIDTWGYLAPTILYYLFIYYGLSSSMVHSIGVKVQAFSTQKVSRHAFTLLALEPVWCCQPGPAHISRDPTLLLDQQGNKEHRDEDR